MLNCCNEWRLGRLTLMRMLLLFVVAAQHYDEQLRWSNGYWTFVCPSLTWKVCRWLIRTTGSARVVLQLHWSWWGQSIPPGAYKNIARWIPELKHRKPDIVFFHCGENDVGREGASTFEISDQIIKIAEEIVKECHPKVLILCQLTHFPAHEPYGEISKRVTERLLQYEKVKRQRIMDTKLKVWTHTIFAEWWKQGQILREG